MDCDIVAKATSVVDAYVGIDEGVFTYLYTLTDVGMGVDLTAFSHFGTFSYVGKGSYVYALGYLCLGRNECQRVDASLLRFHGFVHLEQFSYALVCVLYPDECGGDWMFQFYALVDKYDARLGVVYIVSILGIGEERDGSFLAFFYLGKGVYDGILIAFYLALHELGYLLGCKIHCFNLFLSVLDIPPTDIL